MLSKLRAIMAPVWLLGLAVVVTIYVSWGIYYLAIDWFGLLKMVTIGKRELWHNFNVLMQYLIFPWQRKLGMPDFPSSASGLKHFQDVKGLFEFAQVVVVLWAYSALRFLLEQIKGKTLGLYRRVYTGLAALPVVLGLMGVLLGFDQFFTLFHQALFPGDSSWLFNPRTDPIINVLPESYFLMAFIIFFVIYEAIMISLAVVAHRQFQEALKK